MKPGASVVSPRIKVQHAPDCRRGRCGGAFRCHHCGRWYGYCCGAHDSLEQLVGPACDTCWGALPMRVHVAADGRARRGRPGRHEQLAR